MSNNSGEILNKLSHQAKVLTEAVANFIITDMCPVSTVDGEGFVSLMEVAEPHYGVLCRRTIMNLINQKFLLMKQ